MMHTVVGSAIGGFVAGAVMLAGAAVMRPAQAFTADMTPQPSYAMPVAYPDEMVTRPVVRASAPVVRTSAPARRVATAPAREAVRREPERSWAKTAMIIGGSSGAGAGVGGLIGGKKGALIGAAIGGGAATIYESTRR